MIFRTRLKTIICILPVLLFFAVKQADSLNNDRDSAPQSRSDDLESLKAKLSKYKTWTLVNPEPVLMEPFAAYACAPPNISPLSPHSHKYILVYVNEIGRKAMMSEKYPSFPKGSIIVKEKLSKETSQVPELLTVMVKRNEGYDRENGNWDYLMVNGDGSNIRRPFNLESCQACHLAYKKSDYVSRLYLPNTIREKLK